MAIKSIELRLKLAWWVVPFMHAAVVAAHFMKIDEEKIIEIAKRGVKVEAVK